MKKKIGVVLIVIILVDTVILMSLIGWYFSKERVLIESPSMMHGTDPQKGVLDSGEFVYLEKIEKRNEIITYFEGIKKGYKNCGEYGDVILYEKNGKDRSLETPIIHRAILWLEFDAEATEADPENRAHFNIPELGLNNLIGTIIVENQFPSYGISEERLGPLELRLDDIYREMKSDPHSGFITKGDNNPRGGLDQYSMSTPVKIEWILGKAILFEGISFVLLSILLLVIVDILAAVFIVVRKGKKRSNNTPITIQNDKL